MKKTTYVMHCPECNQMVNKDEKDGMTKCPPKKKSGKFKGFPQLSLPDYKRSENYPQWAPNLPGDGVVHSYQDYKRKLKAAGMAEVGDTSESRYRAKHLKRKPKNMQTELKKVKAKK